MTVAALDPLAELCDSIPLPLAQLVARAHNANSILERHQCVFYLGETALKLAAVVRAAPLLAAPQPPPMVAAAARKLARASLGHWQELLREADRASGESDRLSDLAVPPAADVLQAMVDADLVAQDAARAARKLGALGVFDVLVAYRNAVIGHGSARVSSFYSAWTERLARVLAIVLASPVLLCGTRLVVTETSEDAEQRARVLEGTSSLPWDRHQLPEGNELWLVRGGNAVSAAPLLCHRNDLDLLRDRIGFLQEVRARRADYLDYLTGEVLELAPVPAGVSALLGAEPISASEPRQASTAVEPGGHVGGFELIERLGRGGQGEVFRARQLGLDRLVAVKVLRRDVAGSDAVRARFAREVRALVRTDHPNVVKVYAAGEADGVLYYAMELIDGVDLGRRSDAAAAIRAASGERDYWPRVAALFAGACDGIQHLHDRGVVHRDLKPENLLLSADGGRLVVTDLGLARLADASAMTASSDVLGTLRTMAPEQLDRTAAASAPAVDIFGLGVALFELATQRRMRDAPTDAAIAALIGKPSPRANRVEPAVPVELADVIARAVELDPAKRWPSAKAFAEALRAMTFAPRRASMRRWSRVVGPLALLGAGAGAVAMITRGRPTERAPADARPTPPIDAAPSPPDAPMLGDGMRHIAGATFAAGSTPDELAAFARGPLCRAAPGYCHDLADLLAAQEPRHEVTVGAFDLDEHELSRGEAVAIISSQPGWRLRSDGVFDEHGALLVALGDATGITLARARLETSEPALPIIGVTWEGARRLCQARGARLPTDDEWELAARGPTRRPYPWGGDAPTCATAVFGINSSVDGWSACSGAGPRRVDELHGRDRTPEGVRDLAGNVGEWVQSEHGRVQLGSGADACRAEDQRVVRGGQFDSLADTLRGARRRFDCASQPRYEIGVRCAK